VFGTMSIKRHAKSYDTDGNRKNSVSNGKVKEYRLLEKPSLIPVENSL
jgi:hypothetical protein